uniref:Uncharacterized protein n=1 Tax=Heterorhabditis bacteriophora TaxID=37862 RepID=A0A1I7WIH9_HETBA
MNYNIMKSPQCGKMKVRLPWLPSAFGFCILLIILIFKITPNQRITNKNCRCNYMSLKILPIIK